MLPIFLAEAVPGNTILSIMGAKVVIGIVMGFIVDAVLRLARRDKSACASTSCASRTSAAATTIVTPASRLPNAYEHHDDVEHTLAGTHGWKGILKRRHEAHGAGDVVHLPHHHCAERRAGNGGEDALAQFLGDNPF